MSKDFFDEITEWLAPLAEIDRDDDDQYRPSGADFITRRRIHEGKRCRAATVWMNGWQLHCTLVGGHEGPHLGRDQWNGLKAWETAGE